MPLLNQVPVPHTCCCRSAAEPLPCPVPRLPPRPAQALLAKAEKDNNSIYLMKVPAFADLPLTTGALLVKPVRAGASGWGGRRGRAAGAGGGGGRRGLPLGLAPKTCAGGCLALRASGF